ncbi:MAG: hypothetical protein A3J49_04345 [Gallionellales bacterium RIFCSPHIGHO2_02_FULL_57_16]|nr:MAG: hypothetical protein A3J49_04345 [Gallionellales bacterium RIFCSPHIGHO2_02_FULL_57_16]
MNEFRFSDEQRKALIFVALKKFPADMTEVFLNESQRIIREWFTDYPVRNGDNKQNRARLEMLATQLGKTRDYMLLLPDMGRQHLAVYWKYGYHKPKGLTCNIKDIESLLFELQRCIADVIQPDGISKSIERELIEKLAWAFVETFRTRPTTSPAGPFMCYLDHLSENILSAQDNGKVVFGKGLVAGVLKHVRKQLDDEDKFMTS